MVGELIVKYDQVGLPGVGTFVAEMVPATFSDKGYTINPPYRRLSFYPGRLEDTLLIDMYAETNHIAREAAKAYVTQYLAELKSILEERKTIVLPGLGRLRATRENTFFFVADEGLDIFPAGVGLEPVSLKTHSLQEEPVVIDVPVPTIEDVPQPVEVPEPAEEEPAEAEPVAEEPAAEPEPVAEEPVAEEPEPVAEEPIEEEAEAPAAAEEASPEAAEAEAETEAEAEAEPETEIEAEPETEIAPEAAPESETAAEEPAEEPLEEPAEEPTEEPTEEPAEAPQDAENTDWQTADWHEEENPEPEKKPVHWGVILLVILLVAVLLFGAFILVSRLMPGTTDFLLYTPEEIDIIKY